MYSFHKFWTSPLSGSNWPAYKFLKRQIWCSDIPISWILQFVVIHIVKDFSIVSEAEVDVSLELTCFLHDPTNVESLISGSYAFSKPSLSGNSQFTHCWSLAWRILKITLLAGKMSTIMWYFKHSLALPFFRIGMKADLFQSCGHCWVFQICWHIECNILAASTFRILNRPAGTL